jgi:hypothetical protein
VDDKVANILVRRPRDANEIGAGFASERSLNNMRRAAATTIRHFGATLRTCPESGLLANPIFVTVDLKQGRSHLGGGGGGSGG